MVKIINLLQHLLTHLYFLLTHAQGSESVLSEKLCAFTGVIQHLQILPFHVLGFLSFLILTLPLLSYSELFTTVLDMLNCLMLGTLVPDPTEKSDDNKKQHGNLVKKLRVRTMQQFAFLLFQILFLFLCVFGNMFINSLQLCLVLNSKCLHLLGNLINLRQNINKNYTRKISSTILMSLVLISKCLHLLGNLIDLRQNIYKNYTRKIWSTICECL